MHSPLASIDFSPYRRLLQAVFKGLSGITVLAVDGTPLYQDGSMPGKQALAAGEVEWSAALGNAQIALGTLIVRFAPLAYAAVTRQALTDVAANISRECAMLEELDAMAEELAKRYEELNMVYATEDKTKDYGQGRAMLQQLVKNYTQFRDIEMTVLLLPNMNIRIVEQGTLAPPADAGNLFDLLQNEVLPALIAGMDPLVINSQQDADATGLRFNLRNKLIVQPIIENESRVTGLLAAINGPLETDFSNSDRNLLEVMARKAAKIILTSFDLPTGLLLRAGLEHHLRLALAKTQQQGGQSCVLGVDIDRMTVVNDTLGRDAGDALIVHVGAMLKEHVRDSDGIARLGGDEFGIVLDDCSPEQCQAVARKLVQRAREMDFVWNGEPVEVSLSIGVVPLNDSCGNVEQILSTLDLTCLVAKEGGGCQVQVYQHQDADLAARKEAMYWVRRLQNALREHRFNLHAQIIAPMDPSTHRTHYEVLIRLPGDDGRMIPPGVFLPPAEHYGLMPAIDRWVFKRLLDEMSAFWRTHGALEVVFSVNLSGQSLTDTLLLDYIVAELAAVPFPHDRLCFEITETTAFAKLEPVKRFIAEVRGMGCSFALDDFGSGLSSYSYLKNLEVDLVKIDGSFISNILEDPVSDVMVQSVIAIARQMGIETVAEFVETGAIQDRLRVLGVDFVQGYGVGKPVPLTDILGQLAAAQAAEKMAACT